MARLIDADELKLSDFQDFSNTDVMNAIDNAPTIEAVPVVHGKWIPITNGRGGNECSECHIYAPSYQNGIEYLSEWCPNCGAKMDKESESNGE